MSKNDDAKAWADAIAEGERLLADMRRDAIRTRHGFLRRVMLRMIGFMEAWIARGKKWRDEDLMS